MSDEIILYESPDGEKRIEVHYQGETVWLTQKQLADLFDVEIPTINYHLKDIFDSGELQENSVIRKIRITAADGKAYLTNLYNLDAIISVGYRVSDAQEMVSTERFVQIIIENLLRAGVQTGEKGARVEFVNLDILPSGPEVQAVGEYKTEVGLKKVAVAIGPEFGSVDDDFIRDAIAVAKRFADLLVVAATSFEASAHSVPSSVGRDSIPPMQVMKVKINPDLSMGDLLKKTGSGNLFLAFGEPDIRVHSVGAELNSALPALQVEILGVDVYDPVKSEIRSSGSGNLEHDIAAWFIDTNYNGEAFFVTHAYFLGADKPFEKLKKALKADINEELWEELYSTKSRPFPEPKTGRIAVKVINHFGDEVMKVCEV